MALIVFESLSGLLNTGWAIWPKFQWSPAPSSLLIGNALRVEEIAKIANGNSARLAEVADFFTDIDSHPIADPASKVQLQSGFVTLRTDDTWVPWRSWGWPYQTIAISPPQTEAEASNNGLVRGIDSHNIGIEGQFGAPAGYVRLIEVRWPTWIALITASAALAWAATELMARTLLRRFRKPSAIAILLTGILVGSVGAVWPQPIPTQTFTPVPAKPSYDYGYASPGGIPFPMSLPEIRELGRRPDGALEFARLVAATAQKPRDSKSDFPSVTGSVVVSFDPATPNVFKCHQIGWPYPMAEFAHWVKEAPVGAAPTPGGWGGEFGWYRIAIEYNRTAWPGTAMGVGIWPHHVLATGGLIAAAYMFTKWMTHMLWKRRARQRHKRGHCVRCNYDLQGLTTAPPTSPSPPAAAP